MWIPRYLLPQCQAENRQRPNGNQKGDSGIVVMLRTINVDSACPVQVLTKYFALLQSCRGGDLPVLLLRTLSEGIALLSLAG